MAEGVAPARDAAFHVLLAVERGRAHSDDQLRSPRVEALHREDRNLATEIVRGTLRWQRVLDREIAARLRDPSMEMHLGVIVALRLGVYQLLFLDRIPTYAAVNESVELAKRVDGASAGGMVNAVLRRLMRERSTLHGLRNDPAAAYPPWMVERWRARFGEDATYRICAAGQQPPPLTVRFGGGFVDAEEPPGTTPGAFVTEARTLTATGTVQVASSPIQDEASQLVGELAAFGAGLNILDACAAPGGKTAILAERNPASTITAMDASAARLRITQRRFPWPATVRFVEGDAATLPGTPQYTSALCDMPCSGTGTLARNPEIRERLQPGDFGRQAERQRAIADAAVRALAPGGRLVYSTCSLEPEENEEVIAALLRMHPSLRVQPMGEALRELHARGILTDSGYALLGETALTGDYLRTLPGIHPCDGFFAAVLLAG